MPKNGDDATNAMQAQMDASTAMMTTLAGSFALQGALYGIRSFNGKNMPLKDFIQDVRNGSAYVPRDKEGQYVKAILGKLQGSARDCTFGNRFDTIEQLIKHLKKRFAPGKNYTYYTTKINELRMKQGDSVGDFFDRLNILLSGAKTSLDDSEQNPTAEAIEHMMSPLNLIAKDVFIRGLPADIAMQVDSSKPTTLQDAYNEAVRVETRMDARIIPDTRHKFYKPYGENNWERTEYSAANYLNRGSMEPWRFRTGNPRPMNMGYLNNTYQNPSNWSNSRYISPRGFSTQNNTQVYQPRGAPQHPSYDRQQGQYRGPSSNFNSGYNRYNQNYQERNNQTFDQDSRLFNPYKKVMEEGPRTENNPAIIRTPERRSNYQNPSTSQNGNLNYNSARRGYETASQNQAPMTAQEGNRGVRRETVTQTSYNGAIAKSSNPVMIASEQRKELPCIKDLEKKLQNMTNPQV